MLRPRRTAAQKKKKETKEEDSGDELDLSEASDDGDFSSGNSDDDFDPNKKGPANETFEDSDEESNEESITEEDSDPESPVKTKNSRKSFVASLRGSTLNKFKKPPSGSLQEILQRSQFKKKKSNINVSRNDSGEEREKTPDFDCSGGLRLSDSSDDDDDKPTTSAKAIEAAKAKSSALIDSINQDSNKVMVDLKSVYENYQRQENDKAKLLSYSSKASSQKENMNISDLLAMGEGAPAEPTERKTSQKRARNTQQASDSESDDGWEEVEDEAKRSYKTPAEGVEVVLKSDFNQDRIQKKVVDLEAQLKRKINRQRKDNQITLHKVNLISWIAHGNFVSSQLNNTKLMAKALELLPKNKNHCYPKDRTDLDYFQQITNWFKSTISLSNTNMYCHFKPRPPLLTSLALQMKFKKAISRRDYVLIFATLLRAIGIQCRVVQSLVVAPLMPPKSELISLSKKPESNKTKSSSSKTNKSSHNSSKSRSSSSKSSSHKTSSSSSKSKNSKVSSNKKSSEESSPHKSSKSESSSGKSSGSTSRSSRSKSKKTAGEPTIPQLDGGDDIASTAKSKKPLKIKALSGYSVDESFIDLEKMKNGNKNISPANVKVTPSIKYTMDSPNRMRESPSAKLFKSSKKLVGGSSKDSATKLMVKESLQAFSPRKTRSRDVPSKSSEPSTSGNKAKLAKTGNVQVQEVIRAPKVTKTVDISKAQANEKTPSTSKTNPPTKTPEPKAMSKPKEAKDTKTTSKDALQVFSPRKLRSRSRSNEGSSSEKATTSNASEIKKPNLKSLQNSAKKRSATGDDEVEVKRVKFSLGSKRSSEDHDDHNMLKKLKTAEVDEDSDGSAKLFKTNKISMKATAPANPKPSSSVNTSIIDRRVLSSDSEGAAPVSPSKKSKGVDIWVEVYSEKDERWLAIDVFKKKVDSVPSIVESATRQMIYVFAWNNDNSIKDISARYCPNLNTTIRKMRVEPKYLDSILNQFVGPKTSRDRKEDNELNKLQLEKPMPTSIAEFKKHPLYALSRHLLKYEAIYPPEPPILGYIRDEPIYPRDCVFVLHTRETWLKEAKVVKLHEQPYKMTKTLKWDNVTKKILRDIPQELFGPWQTKDYEPPVAVDGIVPRNAYGNVELFKPQMLPIGCVHLQLPGLNKVCKKLGVDCSQAIVGFDSNGGWPFPVYDGYIICEEFQEKVLDGWNREQEEQEVKQLEKYEKRVYGNWKKLIKGLLIRERLKNKYNFEGDKSVP